METSNEDEPVRKDDQGDKQQYLDQRRNEAASIPVQVDPSRSHQVDGRIQSMLGIMLYQLSQQPGSILAPKSIHQVVADVVAEAQEQLAIHPGCTTYVEPAYDLRQAALIFVMSELSNILGPTVKITPYQHPENHNHVVFQFKT